MLDLRSNNQAKLKYLFTLICLLALGACSTTKEVAAPITKERAKNVILLIGDGMGLTQITAGTFANSNTSNFERFKEIGLHKPYSYDKLITDSAAGATAFACGIKTYNGAIGVRRDSMPAKSILERAEEAGFSTGLISTSSITHATPASFIAHVRWRKNMEAIAADFLNTEVDFFVGGGRKYFDARDADNRNLLQELRDKGYVISSYFEEDLNKITVDASKNFGYLTASEEPLRRMEGREYLHLATNKALEHLDKHGENGFFLMVEGSQIDWGGHANDIDWILSEFQEFDQVVGRVLDWAKKDGETLVIVTADHETGGLAIQPDSKMNKIVAAFTSDYHTGTMIPVFAFGPGASEFSGIYENTDIYFKMKTLMGL